MAGLFPQHVIDEIRDRADIVDIVSNYVPLKRAGSNFKALCPFHNEKTPSFNVSPAKQIFHCFGCGKGGNVFSFVMEWEKVSFPEAVQLIADRIGYKVPREVLKKADYNIPQKKRLYEINAYAAKLYNSHLLSKTGEPARKYLHERGITSESISGFNLGLAPDSWDWLISQSRRADSIEKMKALGLILPRKEASGFYDRFRNRLMFPIPDSQGRIVGFGGRSLDGSEPKYLNSPDSALFNKTNNLYGLDKAKSAASKQGYMMIMEGYTDVIIAHQAGFESAVATLGTALTEQQVRLLKRYAERVIMVYDSDEAGRKASNRGIDLALRAELQVRIVDLPKGKDPCEFINENGAKKFADLIDQAKDLFDYKISMARKKADFDTVEGQAAVIDGILTSVVNYTMRNKPKQELLLRKIAGEFGISESSIRNRMAAIQARSGPSAAAARNAPRRKREREVGDWIVELMLTSPEYARKLSEAEILDFVDLSQYRAIFDSILLVLDEEGKVEISKVFSRLEDPALSEILSGISAGMPDSIDSEKMFGDILEYFKVRRTNREISKQTEQFAGQKNRTEDQEAQYLREVARLKNQGGSNRIGG